MKKNLKTKKNKNKNKNKGAVYARGPKMKIVDVTKRENKTARVSTDFKSTREGRQNPRKKE